MLAAAGGMLETFSLSLGRVGGTGGGSRAAEGLESRSRSRTGFGAGAGTGDGEGDADRDEAPVCGWVSFLFRFSNLASSEDTGLWFSDQQLASRFHDSNRQARPPSRRCARGCSRGTSHRARLSVEDPWQRQSDREQQLDSVFSGCAAH